MDENQEHDIIKGHKAVKLFQVQMPVPPPPGTKTPFKSLQEWLFYICDNNQLEKPVSQFMFALSEPMEETDIFLAGYNTAGNARHLDFKPAKYMFFTLPQEEYGHLSKEQLRERVFHQLKEFTKTAKFQDSFLSTGYVIINNFDQEIWAK